MPQNLNLSIITKQGAQPPHKTGNPFWVKKKKKKKTLQKKKKKKNPFHGDNRPILPAKNAGKTMAKKEQSIIFKRKKKHLSNAQPDMDNRKTEVTQF